MNSDKLTIKILILTFLCLTFASTGHASEKSRTIEALALNAKVIYLAEGKEKSALKDLNTHKRRDKNLSALIILGDFYSKPTLYVASLHTKKYFDLELATQYYQDALDLAKAKHANNLFKGQLAYKIADCYVRMARNSKDKEEFYRLAHFFFSTALSYGNYRACQHSFQHEP